MAANVHRNKTVAYPSKETNSVIVSEFYEEELIQAQYQEPTAAQPLQELKLEVSKIFDKAMSC